MKWFGWIGVAICALIACAAYRTSNPATEFDFAGKYIETKRTSYQEVHDHAYSWPPYRASVSPSVDTISYQVANSVVLRGLPAETLMETLRKHFSPEEGWSLASGSQSGESVSEPIVLQNKAGDELEMSKFGSHRVLAIHCTKLSAAGRWLVIATHGGKNPFARTDE